MKVYTKIAIMFIPLTKVFNHSVDQLKKDEDFIYKNFFKAKANVSKLKDEMIGFFNTSLSLTGKSFDDLCDEAGI